MLNNAENEIFQKALDLVDVHRRKDMTETVDLDKVNSFVHQVLSDNEIALPEKTLGDKSISKFQKHWYDGAAMGNPSPEDLKKLIWNHEVSSLENLQEAHSMWTSKVKPIEHFDALLVLFSVFLFFGFCGLWFSGFLNMTAIEFLLLSAFFSMIGFLGACLFFRGKYCQSWKPKILLNKHLKSMFINTKLGVAIRDRAFSKIKNKFLFKSFSPAHAFVDYQDPVHQVYLEDIRTNHSEARSVLEKWEKSGNPILLVELHALWYGYIGVKK